MMQLTDDIRIKWAKVVLLPVFLGEEMPMTERASSTIFQARAKISDILQSRDRRLLVLVGPCSIHDTNAASEHATTLKNGIDELSADLAIVMRVYFEKPLTTIVWKGLINDPYLDQSKTSGWRRKIRYELSSFDGITEMPVVATQCRSGCSENSFDEADERRAPPAHTMASHRFPLDHIPYSNC